MNRYWILPTVFFIFLSACSSESSTEASNSNESHCEYIASISWMIWFDKDVGIEKLEKYHNGLISGPSGDPPGGPTLEAVYYTNVSGLKRYHMNEWEKSLEFDDSMASYERKVFDLIYAEKNMDRWGGNGEARTETFEKIKDDFYESCMNGNI